MWKQLTISGAALLTGWNACAQGPTRDLAQQKVEDFDYYWDFSDQADAADFAGNFYIDDGKLKTTSNYVRALAWPSFIEDPANNYNSSSAFSYTYEMRVRAAATAGKGVSGYDKISNNPSIGGFSLTAGPESISLYYGIDTAGDANSLILSKPVSPTNQEQEFFDIRVLVRKEQNATNLVYSLIVDGQRAGTFLLPARHLSLAENRMLVGDIGSDHFGQIELDHIGFTDGAVGPGRPYLHPGLSELAQVNANSEKSQMEAAPFEASSTVVSVRLDYSCLPAARFAFVKSVDGGASWDKVGCIPEGSTRLGNPMIRQVDRANFVIVYRDEACLNEYGSADYASCVNQVGAANAFSPLTKTASELGLTAEQYRNTPADYLPSANYNIWSIRSYDGGATWKDRCKISNGFTGDFKDFVIAADPADPNAPKKIVVPLTVADLQNDYAVTRVFTSDAIEVGNCGVSPWTEAVNSLNIDFAGVDPRGTEDGSFEPTIAQRTDGTLEMYMRTSQGFLWQSQSYNAGRQWKDFRPTATQTSNTNGYLTALSDGTLALLYHSAKPEHEASAIACMRSHRQNEAQDTSLCREELNLVFSSDNGTSWSAPTLLAAQAGQRLGFRMFEYESGVLWIRIGVDWYSFDLPQ